MENLYDILGVDQHATNAEIKSAYKKLATQYHPDRNPSAEAEERFKAISHAYGVLSNFFQRLQYEQEMGISHEQEDTEPQQEIDEQAINLYEVLGLDRNATNAEIKDAYKILAAQYHPDRNPSTEAEAKFKDINLAYQVLSDFYLRLQYENEFFDDEVVVEEEDGTIEKKKEYESSDLAGHEIEEEEPPIVVEASVVEEEPETAGPIFSLKWKIAVLATPIIVLIGIGILKVFATAFQNEPAKINEQSTLEVKNEAPKALQEVATYKIWELKRMVNAKPDECIAYIDALKASGEANPEMDDIRKKALLQLPAKASYYFETNECDKAKQAYKLAQDNKVKLSPHLQKKLDFYLYRCATEAQDYATALAILDNMLQRYKHHYSILAAKSQLLHHQLKQTKEAINVYRKARLLYEYQKIDQKFIDFWLSDVKTFNIATLMAQEAQAQISLGKTDLGKQMALEAIAKDSTQALPYELIGNQFSVEENTWGACKYWHKALENGSTFAADSIIKYCK